MEARGAVERRARGSDALRRAPVWVLGLIPLIVIVVAVALFVALKGPGL